MSKAHLSIVGILLLFCASTTLAKAHDQIQVKFTNNSGYKVSYSLNGGSGIKGSLANNGTANWSMVVDPGVAPAITIYQIQGKALTFTVEDGGHYVFRYDHGRIVNSYE